MLHVQAAGQTTRHRWLGFASLAGLRVGIGSCWAWRFASGLCFLARQSTPTTIALHSAAGRWSRLRRAVAGRESRASYSYHLSLLAAAGRWSRLLISRESRAGSLAGQWGALWCRISAAGFVAKKEATLEEILDSSFVFLVLTSWSFCCADDGGDGGDDHGDDDGDDDVYSQHKPKCLLFV